MAFEQRLAEHEDHPAQGHADAGQAEAIAPAEVLAEQAAEHRGPEGAEIDAVIVEGEAGIPARVPLRIELSDDGGDVGLEEAHSKDDQRDRQIEDVDPHGIGGLGHLIAAGRQHRRQRRGRGQVDDLQAAALGGAEGVGLALHHQADLAAVHPALGGDLIGLACIGQNLAGRFALHRHGQVAGDQQQGAEGHGLAGAQIAVGQDAADQRQQIDQRGV